MGRKYRIVVNGKTYDVDVEDLGAGAAAPAAAPARPAATTAPKA